MQKILVVGTIGFDTVKTCHGLAERVIGGSASYASIAASFFSQVSTISVVGKDFEDKHAQNFIKRGVDMRGIEVKDGKTFFWAASYDKDFKNAFTEVTDLNVLSEFNPKISGDHKTIKHAFVGNVDPLIQIDLIKQIKGPKLITCDTMNYWINSNLSAVKKVIKQTDILFVSETEARMLTGEYNLIKAGKAILKMGAGHVIIKLGPNGAMLVSPLGFAQLPPMLVEDLHDTTGAGDTFGGAFTGYLASQKSWNNLKAIKTAMAIGTVMASFAIESFSIDRISRLTQAKINARLKAYIKSMQF